jgi:glycosyltransferase involved in cell wall biosynthesis
LLRKPLIVKIVGDFAWEQGTQRAGISMPLDTFVRTKRVPFLVSFLRSLQTYVARQARTVIVPSEYLKGIVAAWGIAPEKINIIYNALSLTEAVPQKTLPAHTIVSVARLVPWKGMRGLIDALVQVRHEVADASLIIIGDGPERAALEAYAQEYAPGAVTFLGAVPHAEALAYMRAGTVFALNSTYEGLSHVLIEALLLELPIVASNAGGNPELITHEQNGVLVPVGDTAALAEAITRLLQDPAYAERLAHAASSVTEKFALPTMLAETSTTLSHV